MIQVVIVNWNSGDQLHECVNSVVKYGAGLVSQIIVVDNGSVDGSESCLEGIPLVTLIRAGANLGFGRACNLGAQKARSEFLLFLNPDARVFENTIFKSLAYMQLAENFEIGVCGVQLIDDQAHVARSCTRFPTLMHFFSNTIGLNRFLPKTSYFMSEWSHDDTREVDHVIGAFYLVRRSLFEQLGGFDERFFVYLEDLDFSCRAHQAGWKSVYLAGAQAFHAGGGTSDQVKDKRLFYSLRSRLLYGFKHFSTWESWTLLLLTCLVEPFTRTLYCFLGRDWKGIKNTFSGYQMLFSALPGMLKNRDRSGQ
ncbi:glycosyltransferase family 2 protein [Marinobacterium aestuarii]|uniref:glycosyltransferase family 2 protein n=1 Tax=Marinobacterium aestuarii TaxID=1821621 RepID=UPI0009FF9FCC|nr:glycosyltransferase family 2 protein [Marinobacterium aestuarii]